MSTTSSSPTCEEEYEVEKILNKKIHDNVLYYKVKWVGFNEPTWEAAENCDCQLAIKEFEEKIDERLDFEEENEWEVEAILDKRINRGRAEYLIKWKGWHGEPTWEKAEDCECINLIAAYENPKLKKLWGFEGSNRNLWVGRKQMIDYMKNYIRRNGQKVNLLNFEPDFPAKERQLPLKEGLNIGPLCYENHWYLVIIFINHICVTRRILVGDSLNTLIGTSYTEHPVMKRLKRVYTHFPIKPLRMTQMDRSDVCAFYTLAGFERALFLYKPTAHFVVENNFFDAQRAEIIRGLVKPESHGEVSVALPLPAAFDHGPMCEFCDQLFESIQSVDEHIKGLHLSKKKRNS